MWNRRDFALLATAAIATFGISLATLWPRLANAGGDTVSTVSITTPTLMLDGVNFYAEIPNGRQNLIDGDVSIPAGRLPKLTLVAQNTTDAEVSTTCQVAIRIAPRIVLGGRGVPLALPAWSSPYAVHLKPHGTQTIEIDCGSSLGFGERATVFLSRENAMLTGFTPSGALAANSFNNSNNAETRSISVLTLVGNIDPSILTATNLAQPLTGILVIDAAPALPASPSATPAATSASAAVKQVLSDKPLSLMPNTGPSPISTVNVLSGTITLLSGPKEPFTLPTDISIVGQKLDSATASNLIQGAKHVDTP